MKIYKTNLLIALLFMAIGNSWATGNLTAVKVPSFAKTEMLIFVTPRINERPTPAICQTVTFRPVVAEFKDSGRVVVVVKDPVSISPGESFIYPIEEKDYPYWAGFEVLASPPELFGKCGFKAFLSIDKDGQPIGTTYQIKFKADVNFD